MATNDFENKISNKPVGLNLVDSVMDSVKKIALETEDDTESSEHNVPAASRPPFFKYSRPQILFLYKSPLVRSPEGMPELKDWFGDWNEQFTTKKDIDNSAASSSNRDRRFRRDPEDSESTSTRPSFRTSLTQPSQMGNFRHQSTRTSDRDREKDVDKEKDRDRDTKDGLRSLSDKFDRDRLSIASTSTTIRRGERDTAPHLTNTASTRLSGQVPLPAGSRRGEVRDPPKRRNGESSDDWRRGAEPPRPSHDEKNDGYRRDREGREQPRSRVRESSRTRRDSPPSRRDRDDKDSVRDRERYRDREDRNERPVRGIDHYSPPRDKEFNEDARRWRDDGKREERLAAKRDRDRDGRERDRAHLDNDRDAPNERSRDRERDKERWSTTDERDSRLRRPSARDRRYAEDGKDEQRDKDRERDKEKEPAWMETYIPSDSHAGILGGQSADGELDSIQAWKKGMKEKEEKDKQIVVSETQDILDTPQSVSHEQEHQMDEIQLFKMLIKREAEKKEGDKQPSSTTPVELLTNDPVGLVNPQHHFSPLASEEGSEPRAALQKPAPSPISQPVNASSVTADDPRSLLSLITSSGEPASSSLVGSGKSSSTSIESQKSPGSRFFPNPLHGDPNIVPQRLEKIHTDRISLSPSSEYNPPQSSRLLALGSRTPSGSSAHSSKAQSSVTPTSISSDPPQHSIQQLKALQSQAQSDLMIQSPDVQFRLQSESPFGVSQKPSSVRQQEQLSPFNHVGRGNLFEEKDPYSQQYDGHRRTSGVSSVSSESGTHADLSNINGGFIGNSSQASTFDLTLAGNQGGTYSSGKGSRFAKFFDNKGRDTSVAPITKPSGLSASSLQGHRQDLNRVHMESQGDTRTMEDIFAMLQSSAQGQRISQPSQLGQTSMFGSNSFGPGMSLQPQQVQQHGPLQPNGRLDALYDSRFEDKSFVPDGMVPGLRTAPPARTRDIGNGYISDHLEEQQIPFSVNRPPPQHRNGDMFNNSGPQLYPHQQGFVRNAPLQQPYRGNPSPIASQSPLQTVPQQRLPPGLANLGGRPPHDSTQFFGNTMSLPSGPQGNVLNNGLAQPVFSNFQTGGFPGGPQMRASSNPHHMQGIAGHNPLVGLNNIDVRGPSQAQLLGLRGYGSQQIAHAQLQAQQLGLRQQQQQHLIPPHIVPHALPPHEVPRGHDQSAHDLMALLMGNNGPHRE